MALRLCALHVLLAALPAGAGVLDRVRHDGVVRCDAEPRIGVAEDAGDGTLAGRAVAFCRAVAAAALGPSGRIAFRLDEPGAPADPGDIAFTTDPAPSAIAEVLDVRLALLVPAADLAQRPQDLAGRAICFLTGSDAQAALEAAFARWRLTFLRMAYQEEDEMADAYAAHRCAAAAGEAQELARLGAGRILQPPVGQLAIRVATPAGDPAWAAFVGRIWRHRG